MYIYVSLTLNHRDFALLTSTLTSFTLLKSFVFQFILPPILSFVKGVPKALRRRVPCAIDIEK